MLRHATQDDSHRLSQVVLIAARSVKEADFSDQGWALFEGTNTPEAFNKRLQSDDYFALVFELDSNIVGYLAIIDYKKIDHMFVLPEHRNKGICKRLWTAAQKVCSEAGNPGYFWVRSSSYAEPIYQSFGFRAKGERQRVNGIRFQLMERHCHQ